MAISEEVLLGFDISLSCLCILIVLLNAAVAALVFVNKNIRSYTNLFIVSLACSDILTGGVLIPIFLRATDFVGYRHLLCMILLLGVANVCCVTYDRYLSISSPLTYTEDIHRRFKVMLILCWTLPILYGLVPLCWEADSTLLAHKIYTAVLEICGIVIPFLFIFVIYCYIFRQVWKCNKKLKSDLILDIATSKKRRKSLFSEAKIARVFATVAILFLLSWAPILYMTTVANFVPGGPAGGLIPDELHLVAMYAVSLSSLVNPILYCFLKQDIKMAVKRCFRRRWSYRPARTSFSCKTATINIALASRSQSLAENGNPIIAS